MPLYDPLLNIGADAMAAASGYAAIHTADPTAAGLNESTAARKAVSWTTAANGDVQLSSSVSFTGGAASGPATHVALWSAPTGGTCLASFALTGDQTFNAAGEYTVNSLALNGVSS